MAEKEKRTVPVGEQDRVSRNLLAWLNTCPSIPDDIDLIQFEYLPDHAPSMALSTIQAAYILQSYITGGYLAEYQFKLIYRVNPGNSNDKRLKADELLNDIGDWAQNTAERPDIGEGKHVTRVEPTTRAALFARYESGEEDHQILMTLQYEVIT